MSQDPFDVILRCRRCPSGGGRGREGDGGGGRNFSAYIGLRTQFSHLALSVQLERDQNVCIDLHIFNPSCFCLSCN